MQFSFCSDFATKHGVVEAIVYSWMCKDGVDYYGRAHNGKTWILSSVRQISEGIGFLGTVRVQRALNSLEEQRLIQSAHIKFNAFDRTKSYHLCKYKSAKK